ncbi:tRNA (adenosine(37)-N6)-dimethylallyltransferase MiaA [Campylobacter sp. RM12654]|uniref:tRNA (adenosine(37)-N6)-dimethylallyltransferase MiaA n=1 Tax=unclassified Campylobacter TaxID=2593542 RepID=UPI001BDA544C|nr:MULTISPECIES: tRNA (adenosine(37)-N6)-dimethylallyltransferase MiaA [unclassified Campylobacter]MBT0878977.1 tRNA (adenosine(37)-N6)-dimethylallyltransferase MiaA [Campylobacter sp. 2018MI01]MBZ7977408.1 tRNA (adenosine(37)-N6)-dimethylallyltransferase MiaA [Campylobacter sp. RM12654]ULO04185.1 tRNA(i6A37) synthase [Campylobacter sp. RM12651]
MKKIALIGTTASGKTNLAHKLAKASNSIILSLDSLCLYKELNIINAKPDNQMLEEIKYFGINLISVNENYNVGLYFDEYKKALEFAKNNEKNLIITGGSGFYLKAMLDGLSPKINDINHNLSLDEIYNLMLKIDKNSNISANDTYRLNKWYSIYKSTNEIPSLWLKANTQEALIKELKIYDILWDKDILNERIRLRTKQMLSLNAYDEVINLYKIYGDTKALNSIGAKEIIDCFNQKISKDELEDLITIHTRQLAKRQRTFNKKFNAKVFNIKSEEDLQNAYESILSSL